MINWSKYFDKIICINYVHYFSRKKSLIPELKRIGILDSGIFEWQITFYDKYTELERKIFSFNYTNNYSKFSCTKGHYNAIKKAYYEGANRVLIIEDDIRFLKDLNKIEQILQNIPDQKDWQVILFNRVPQCTYIEYFNIIKNKNNRLNNYFCKFKNITLYSTACYCLNRKGMENILNIIDTNYITLADMFWNGDKTNIFSNKRIGSTLNLSIPILFFNSISINNTHISHIKTFLKEKYKNQDINLDDYMMNINGTKYNYGDCIEE